MPLRLFYAADVHGSERCFRKLLNAAKFYNAQALLLGGDLTGKLVVPLVSNPDGTFRSEWLERERIKASEVEQLEGDLANSGMYTCRVSPREMEELEGDARRTSQLFTDLMKRRLSAWLTLAEERLRPLGIKLYLIFGNDDRRELDSIVRESQELVFCDGRVVDLGGYEVAGFGYTNPTPWNTPRELPEEEMMRRLKGLVSGVRNMERAIFDFHCPPLDTALDLAPKLTADMKVVARAGTTEMQHVGSRSVRSIILERQPLLGLHGHIHESRGEDTLGRTLCLNPGSEYSEGLLHGVIIDLEGGRLINHQFTIG